MQVHIEAGSGEMADTQLAELLQRHLGLQVPDLAARGTGGRPVQRGGHAHQGASSSAATAAGCDLSLEAWLEACGEQLQLEEAEEVAQAEAELAGYSAAGAQVCTLSSSFS